MALRELAFGKCRRVDSQIALGHAMSLFGLRRELYGVFQYAYQLVTHFEGRVGRVWACAAGISHCLGAVRTWDTTVHAADASLSWRFKGPLRATSKPHGASDLDLLNLTDSQALCLGARTVFPEIPVELNAAKDWRVLCAWRWRAHHGTRVRSSPFDFLRNLRKKPIARASCASTKGRSSLWSVARLAHNSRALPLMPVFVIGGSRQSVIQQMSRRADSSGHRHTMRASVRLQTQGMSSTHRVLTATLCNESKRKRISVPSLDLRQLMLLKSSSEQPTEPQCIHATAWARF